MLLMLILVRVLMILHMLLTVNHQQLYAVIH